MSALTAGQLLDKLSVLVEIHGRDTELICDHGSHDTGISDVILCAGYTHTQYGKVYVIPQRIVIEA